jgi:phosphatidate cytidylyltransferase
MLRTRVLTAVALLALLGGMLFLASRGLWALFVLVVALAACWEWSRLCGFARRAQSIYLLFSGAVGGALWMLYLRAPDTLFPNVAITAFIVAAAFWIAAAPMWLRLKLRPAPGVGALAGWLVIWPTWFAFVVLRDAGPWVLLAVAAIVWIADIAAYFAGRRFGRRKLAPEVSPKKSWEGVYGALAGVALYGLLLAALSHWQPTQVSPFFRHALGIPAVGAMLVLAVLSVVGDLFESWMKRVAGLKDSSNLLPGHGGVLDRIDALTSTLPIAALAIALYMRGVAP